ncbi:ArsR family transcriptional regulator [Streptomyces sp. NPDC096030]|uniref:ArsR family transcriptional regulator n=1 Tax=Streptomyces sp. NPDC096030 TaxID=3155423 RepID=UPI0033320420
MLRIHFTAADLQRISWAACPEPLVETVFSIQLLQQPQADSQQFIRWSSQVRRSIGRSGLLFDLATPDDGTLPDLLIAPAGAATLGEGLEAVRHRPAAQAAADLAVARSLRPDLPRWIADFHHRRPEATSRLARLLGDYHRVAIAPAWSYIEHAVRAASCGAAGDAGAVLGSLHPSVGWEFPVLTVPCHIPHDVDVRLAGRGLLLVPSFFLRAPTARLDNHSEQAPVELYFPVRHCHTAAAGDDCAPDPGLARLLGRSRAAVLTTLASACSTTEAAARAGISAATASHHLSALRAGGLVSTVREHGTARHSLTHLGLRLLYSTPRSAGRPPFPGAPSA